MHAILHGEPPCDRRAVQAHHPLEQAHAEPVGRRLLADHRRRQLAMIAGEHHAVASQQRYPAARLGALAGFIDHAQIEAPRAENLAIQRRRRCTQHGGRVENAFGRLGFELAGVGQQRSRVVAELLSLARLWRRTTKPAGLAEKAHRLLDQLPRKLDVVVSLDEQVQRVIAQLGQHAGRVAQPHCPLAAAQQPLEDIIDRQIARGAGQHPASAAHRLTNHLDDGRRLAGAGRPVNQAHVARGKSELDRLALHGIQRMVQRPDFRIEAKLRLPHAHQHVAQDGKAVAAGGPRLVQRRALPLQCHVVKGNVQPPAAWIVGLLGQAFQGHANRPLAALADYAASGRLGVGFLGRKHDWTADA